MHTRNCAICSLVAAGCSRAEGHLEAAVETRQRTIGLDWLLVLTNQVGRNLCCGSFDQHLKAFFRRSRTFYYWRCKPTPSKAIKKGKKAWTRFSVRKGSGRPLKTGFLSLSFFPSHSLNSCTSLSFHFISFLTSFSLLFSTCRPTLTFLQTSVCLEYSNRKCLLDIHSIRKKKEQKKLLTGTKKRKSEAEEGRAKREQKGREEKVKKLYAGVK